MIQSKLYIPTSTLNFNSIMASESISPAGFYPVRGFGYKRFQKVTPNNLENRIILYDKYPDFEVNDKELENYPLIIEIETKTINDDIIKEYKDGIYYSEQTIYFNPFTTKFFFREEREKRSTLSKAEPSIEAKMVPLYKKYFLIKEENVENFDWKPSKIADTNSNFDMHISKDRRVNKLKGILYAYLFGSNKSLPDEIVSLKKSAKELRNILSAIVSSPNGQATFKQEQHLSKLYHCINDSFYKVEGLDKRLHNILKQKAEHYHCDNFIDILKGEELFETWRNKQDLRPSYSIKHFSIPYSISSDERQRLFDDYIAELERNINIFVSTRNTNAEKLPIIQHFGSIEQIPNQIEILKKLLNEYLNEAYTRTEFLQSRYDFAFSGGKLFRGELHEKWDGSDYQTYINSLLKNLKEHTSFDLNETSSPTLKSFGAFCQKGDDEIDKLEDYLISNSIADFRIAFSLWGVIFGFANMPKTLTNDLFLSDNNKYKSEVYKYIFKQLHGIELEGEFETWNKQEDIAILLKQDEKKTQSIKTEEKKTTTIQQQAGEIEIKYREKIKQIPKITDSQIDSIIDILKTKQFVINDKLYDAISKTDKIFGKKTNLFKAIKESLGNTNQEKSIQHKNQNSLFENMYEPVGKDFYNDRHIFYNIESMIPDNKRKDVKTEIDWIQKVHCESGYKKKSGKWVKLEDHSNIAVIQHFENNAKNRIEESLLGQIVLKLKELYL